MLWMSFMVCPEPGGAEVEDFLGEGLEVAAGAAEGFFVTAHHEGEGSGGGSGGAAAHAGVHVGDAFAGGHFGEAPGVGGAGGGEVIEDEALPGIGENPVFAFQVGFDLGRGGDDEDDDGAAGGHFGGRGDGGVFLFGVGPGGLAGNVPDGGGDPGTDEVVRDAASHVSEAYDADFHVLHEVLSLLV